MIKIIKQASAELQSFDDNDIVKVAGVLRRLKNWLGSLGNEEYRTQLENLHNESTVINVHLSNLSKHINLLQSAIKDADIKSYELELEEVKFLSKQLSDELEKLNSTATLAKIPQDKEFIDKNTDIKINDSKNRSGYDVPFGPINKPYKSFEHFNQISSDLIVISDVVKSRILQNLATKLDRLKLNDQLDLFKNNMDAFLIVFKEAITNGVVLENSLVQDAKKERPSGQTYVKIRTAPFSVPGINLKIQGVVLLTDLYAQKSPKMKLSVMRFTDIEIEKISKAERKIILNKIANQVGRSVTNLSPIQLAEVLKNAYIKVFGKEPTLQVLGTAWAQSMAEQSGHYINNNIGNITATKGWVDSGGNYWSFDTTEFDNSGKPRKESMKFRAYNTIDDGAVDYWKQLATSFKGAFKWFGTGDALHSALALGDQSYYTADRTLYAGNMSSLYETFLNNVAPNLNLISKPTLPPSRKFPEYKAHINSPNQPIPEKFIDKINKNTAYKIVNDNNKQYVVLNRRLNNDNKQEDNKNENMPVEVAQNDNIDSEVNDLMNYLFKSAKSLDSIVKNALEEKLLPKTQLLITIASVNDFHVKMKYAAIVSELLEKNINAKTDIMSDGDIININCIAAGDNKLVTDAVLAICEIVSDGFYFKDNSKIIKSILKENQFSKFASISYEEIERCLRKCDLEMLNKR